MTAAGVALRIRARRRKTRVQHVRAQQQRGALQVVLVSALVVLLGVVVTGSVATVGFHEYNEVVKAVGPAESVVSGYSRGGARVYDRNGVLLYEFVDEFVGLRRPVPLRAISPSVVQATVAVEDPDFWTNSGINVRGTVRAGVENFAPFVAGGTTFMDGTGGSSITQQLARNVYMTRDEREDRSLGRKLREMAIAHALTERYPKEQLIEWYLNLLPYGGIYVGIESAAQGYFGKSAADLSLAEAALLVGIPQSPSRYYPHAPGNFDAVTGDLAPAGRTKARQAAVLGLMVESGAITAAQANEALQEPLRFREPRFDVAAPHFVLGRIADEVTARFGEHALYGGGLEIVTTLDLGLQRIAEEIVDRNVREFGEQANLHNGAYVALDPHTGQILVYVGSRDYFNLEIEGQNDNVVARNSPGSTLKPFTFLTAFTQGWGTGTGILDTPLTIPDGVGGDFTPRNPGGGFQGPVTAAVALGNSFNITAIKTMIASGVPETIEMYQRFGYTTLDNPGGYGPALTTGGGEITLMDQAIAYSVLAAGGIMRGQEAIVTEGLRSGERTLEPIALLRVSDPDGRLLYEFDEPEEQRIVPEEYAYLVTSILNDPQNTCITYSSCGALALENGYPSAAKTGTSEPFETAGLIGETWTMGYTPHIVSGIWAGNANNDPIQGIFSTTVSLRAWKEFTTAAIEYLDLPATDFERPPGVEERQVCWPSGLLVTAACPATNRYTSLYAAEVLPAQQSDAPAMYDSWWRGGRLVLPRDEIERWSGLHAWSARHGVSVGSNTVASPAGASPAGGSPTEGSSAGGSPAGGSPAQATRGEARVAIVSPAAGSQVSGQLTISGSAYSSTFAGFSIEVGEGAHPSTWYTFVERTASVEDGTLGAWDTERLPDGEYVFRLTMYDGSPHTTQVRVTIRN